MRRRPFTIPQAERNGQRAVGPIDDLTMKRNGAPVVQFGHGDTLAYVTSLDRLRRVVPFADVTISTTLPRGGLQVVQPRGSDPNRMRLYVREQHLNDLLAWSAMKRGRPLRLGQLERSENAGERRTAAAFAEGFLGPSGFAYAAAAPLAAPVLAGFPGVIHLFRAVGAGDFTTVELRRLAEVAAEFDAAIAETRGRRRSGETAPFKARYVASRQIAVRAGKVIVFPGGDIEGLDGLLLSNLLEIVEARLSRFGASLAPGGSRRRSRPAATGDADEPFNGSNADRLLVPDDRGEHAVFRLSLFPRYPALTPGEDVPVAVASLQPECESWGELRPSDFEADEEIARLVPALQYMVQNFTGGSSLEQIARTAHLSPYHFHRRFTDLLGITPKHYLFDCQILEAKRRLAIGQMALAEIAQRTGFAHQSHFTSRFKQATGLTPTRWRRLVESEAAVQKAEHPAPTGPPRRPRGKRSK